jgi:hypothetical protein
MVLDNMLPLLIGRLAKLLHLLCGWPGHSFLLSDTLFMHSERFERSAPRKSPARHARAAPSLFAGRTNRDRHLPINARVTEISLYGCYLDMINPPPVGTSVFVKVFTETAFFETAANVVYSHPNLGIGVTFRNVSPDFLPILRKWLLEAMCSTGTSQKS